MKSKRNITTIHTLQAAFALLSIGALALAVHPAAAQGAGGTLYKGKCAGCHGADGKGATSIGKANNIRDLGSAEVQKQSDADLTTILTAGKGKMPAYGKSLKPDQIKDLVAYIRSLATK